MKQHKHQCGFTLRLSDILQEGGYLDGGCGHEWEHADNLQVRCTKDEFYQAHRCPKCGKGPWLWQKNENTIREREEEEQTLIDFFGDDLGDGA